MSPLLELSTAVRTRRTDMGLTQATLAAISGLSRATVNQVETGAVKDLSMTRATRLLESLGLSMSIANPHPRPERTDAPKRRSTALEIAARTASVSYRRPLEEAELQSALLAGDAAPAIRPHLLALLDEAPVSLLASVVEQLHRETGQERTRTWRQMRTLAHALQSDREIWR